jgi:endonuclease-3 related protein
MPAWGASSAAIVAALAEFYGTGTAASTGPTTRLDPLAALVTVLLSRAADPRKAEQGCAALAEAGLLESGALAEADIAELGDTLRASGVRVAPRVLAPIQRVARWLVKHHADRAAETVDEGCDGTATETLRSELSALRGIGPATADALLLYALGRPVYPVDRATYRIFVRHGWFDVSADYEEARAVIEGPLSDQPSVLVQLADSLGRVGTEFCRARVAKCQQCPLRPFLPEGGPIDTGTAEDWLSD